jgi:capsular exopolysaccharide synthesis family protein
VTVEPREYVRILRRGWYWIAAGVLGAVAVASAVILAAEPQYVSTARLLVTVPLDEAPLDQAGALSEIIDQRVRSYVALVDGDVLASRVAESQELDGAANTPGYEVSAEVVPDTNLLDITVTSRSPEAAKMLVAGYAEEFEALVAENETVASDGEPALSVAVVGAASPPSAIGSRQPLRTLSLAVILGSAVGVGAAFLWDAWDTRIRRPDELVEITEAPMLGVIPVDGNSSKHPPTVEVVSRGPRAEPYRRLRANLQLLDPNAGRPAMTITSSVPGEGKTTTAVNLGIALADSGIRVLLLDGDLRRPKVAAYLGLRDAVGLTSLLTGTAEVDDAIQPSQWSSLQVIASGPQHPNPGELLYGTAMSALLEGLRTRADVVLIDSPSLLPVADAAVLAALSDGAILVTRYGVTRAERVRQAVVNLEQAGGGLLGTVLTMVPTRGPDAYPFLYEYGEPGSAST